MIKAGRYIPPFEELLLNLLDSYNADAKLKYRIVIETIPESKNLKWAIKLVRADGYEICKIEASNIEDYNYRNMIIILAEEGLYSADNVDRKCR